MTIDEQQLIAMLSDPSTQRKAFELVVRQYSEPTLLAGSPYRVDA